MEFIKNIFFVGLFLASIHNGFSQNFDKSRGLPFVRNYLPEQYHAHEQNFDVIQSSEGFMYFANFAGILEYDGSTWNKILSSSGMRVVSLAKNEKGRIFVGGLYDFGYLESNKKGQTSFVSLALKQANLKDIGLIFKVICLQDKIYFISENKMYVYDGSKLQVVPFKNHVASAFSIKNDLYLFFNPEKENSKYSGLYIFKNDSYSKIELSGQLSLIDVVSMLPVDNGSKILIGSSNQGLFILDNQQIGEYSTPVNSFLSNNRLTSCIRVDKTTIALGTVSGIVLINEQGKIIQVINHASGLNNESINGLFLDKKNGLWIATENGIAKAEINWPLSYVDNKSTGLDGKVLDIKMFGNRLYFATDKGLYYLEGSSIYKIKAFDNPCLCLLVNGNELVIGTSRGVFSLTSNNQVKQISEEFTFTLSSSEVEQNVIFSGLGRQMISYRHTGSNFEKINTIDKIMGDVVNIHEDASGDLLIEVSPGRIYLFQKSINKLSEISNESGLLSLHLNKKGNEIFISSEKGLYKVNKSKFEIEPFSMVSTDSATHNIWMHQLYEISDGKSIFTNGEQKSLSFLNIENNKVSYNQTPFLPLADHPIKSIWYDKETAQIWAGGKDGLIILDQKNNFDYSVYFNTIIRKITLLNKDSIIELKSDKLQKINFKDNSLVFEFAIPVFPVVGEVKFRYFLKGFDKDTSSWTNSNKKEYTNLPDGQYEFVVEAMNEFGHKAQQASYSFKILTPVYRQWWAFIIYALLLAGMGRWFVIWRTRKTRKEKERLEDLVKERTEEIERSKQKIEEQRDIAYKQKKEILDSISYAQRIQQAVLPSQQYAEDILLEHFILYRPRDIVSGDFYWMKKINNYVVVVAADCTGHGVPGAFMSMLGSSFLNEIVTRRSLDSASQILNRLRSKVKKSLHQEGKEGEQKDGMDIALIIIDSETLQLQYSGAYNPLYIIRQNKAVDTNDESIDLETRFEFIQLKADRQPIGIHLNERDFTNHEFQLQNGDNLYSFSDGYVDQFGGETGEKFKNKRFKDLLLSVQGKPMQEQKQILEHAFVRWKRDLAQIDDVLVMGIKI
jgi:serine phosphatase RsbU (regulator of sigma subunit)/ligand-binding sensor domain-containing protein